MAKAMWTFTARDKSHTVELEHAYWSGRAAITVDGEEIERSKKLIGGSTHNFQVSGVPCILEIIETGFRYRYELFVDGQYVLEENARRIRYMRNGLGALHIYFRAMLYSYLLFFVLLGAYVVTLLIASVTGQLDPPQEGIWWFPFIAVFLAVVSYAALYYFTRRAKFWGVYRDVFSRRTKISGHVSRKWVRTSHNVYTTRQHCIKVNGKSFEVFGKVHEQVRIGDEVTISYWPRSETVASVERLNV